MRIESKTRPENPRGQSVTGNAQFRASSEQSHSRGCAAATQATRRLKPKNVPCRPAVASNSARTIRASRGEWSANSESAPNRFSTITIVDEGLVSGLPLRSAGRLNPTETGRAQKTLGRPSDGIAHEREWPSAAALATVVRCRKESRFSPCLIRSFATPRWSK